jgi:hypothetical protein
MNGDGIERDEHGNVAVHAPPAVARGLAPTPGSAVPTPARLSVPMAQFEVSVPINRVVSLIRLLKDFYGDDFPFVPNLSLEFMSHLSASEVAELQEMFKPKEVT